MNYYPNLAADLKFRQKILDSIKIGDILLYVRGWSASSRPTPNYKDHTGVVIKRTKKTFLVKSLDDEKFHTIVPDREAFVFNKHHIDLYNVSDWY